MVLGSNVSKIQWQVRQGTYVYYIYLLCDWFIFHRFIVFACDCCHVMLGASNTWISSQVIERKGAEVLVTRDCLSNLEGFRSFLYSQIFLKPNMHSMILCTSWAIQLLPHHQDRHPSRQIRRLPSRKPGCKTRPVCSQQNWGARCLQVLRTSLNFGIWNHLLLDLSLLACSGTTTTTRPTASATLTTGATRPPSSSPLDLWQLLASPSSLLSSDDFVWEAFFTKSLPIGRLGSSAMANAIISHITCLSCLFWQLEKNIPSHWLKLDGILHHTSTN